MMQVNYLNNNIFRFSFIGGINIITHAIFNENQNSSNAVIGCCVKKFRVSVLWIYMTSIDIYIS